jgi:hypothetical protein
MNRVVRKVKKKRIGVIAVDEPARFAAQAIPGPFPTADAVGYVLPSLRD